MQVCCWGKRGDWWRHRGRHRPRSVEMGAKIESVTKKLFSALKNISNYQHNKRKFNTSLWFFFLYFVISVRGGHYYYSSRPAGRSKKIVLTLIFCGIGSSRDSYRSIRRHVFWGMSSLMPRFRWKILPPFSTLKLRPKRTHSWNSVCVWQLVYSVRYGSTRCLHFLIFEMSFLKVVKLVSDAKIL